MWILVVLLAVSVLATIAARRWSSDARDSVDLQRQRLDALRTAVSGMDLPAARTPGPAGRPSRSSRSSRWGRRRRWSGSTPIALRTVFVAALVVLLLAAALGLVARLVSSDDTTAGTPAKSAARQPSKSAASTTTSSTTSTTPPPGVAVVGTQGGVITISVPAGGYRLALTAHGACWIRAERSDNTVVETTTLHDGDARDLAESGPLTVRLGNPGVVDVAVDGQVLALPVQSGAAVDLHLVPSGSRA